MQHWSCYIEREYPLIMETLICNLFLKHTKMSKNRRKHRPRQQHLTKKNSNTLRMTWVRSHVPLECLEVIIFRCLQLSFHKNLSFFSHIPKHFTHTQSHIHHWLVSFLIVFADILNYHNILFPIDSSGSTFFPPVFRPTGISFTFIPMFNLHILSNSHSSSLHATLLPFRIQLESFLF